MREDVCICIPTKRPQPVLTLGSYPPPKDVRVFIIADPAVLEEHCKRQNKQISVMDGSRGMGAQSANCYRVAAENGFTQFFRMDDDLPPKSFIHIDGHYPDLDEALESLLECMKIIGKTLVGFVNTSNRYWLKKGFAETYGIIHGGANLSIASHFPETFIDPKLLRCEDIYRTCGHRKWDLEHGGTGRNGRVQYIGIDKSKSTSKQGGNVSTISLTREQILAQRKVVMDRFPEFISRLDDQMVRFRR